MALTDEEKRIVDAQYKMSPFDPRFIHIKGAGFTTQQQTEVIRVTVCADMEASSVLQRMYGDPAAYTPEKLKLYESVRSKAYEKELQEHWKRWEEMHGRENLPEHVKTAAPPAHAKQSGLER